MPNAHPLQVNPGISLLSRFEGFSFVSGLPFPNSPFVGTWPVVSGMTGNGLDITAYGLDDFPGGHVNVNPFAMYFTRGGNGSGVPHLD